MESTGRQSRTIGLLCAPTGDNQGRHFERLHLAACRPTRREHVDPRYPSDFRCNGHSIDYRATIELRPDDLPAFQSLDVAALVAHLD